MATNIQIQNVQRIRTQSVTQALMNTDMTTNVTADWHDMPFIDGTADLTLTQEMLNPGHALQNRDDYNEEILGVKSWTLAFSINLGPSDARAGDGTTYTQPPVGYLLSEVMGGETLGTGDNTGAGSTSEVVVVDTAARWNEGGIMGWKDSSGVYHWRPISAVSGSNVTLKWKLPSAPAENDVIYNAASYYLENQAVASVKTFQFIVEGLGTSPNFEDCWVLQGGQCVEAPSIELPKNGIPRLTFTFKGNKWLHGDAAALTPAALGTATYSNTNEVINADCDIRMPVVGTATTTGNEFAISDLTLNFGFHYIQHESPGGVNGISGYVLGGGPNEPKASGSFRQVYENKTWLTARDNKENRTLFYQIGTTTAGGVFLDLPTIQITDFKRMDLNGLAGQEASFKARLDEDTTEGTATAMGTSPVRIHIW